MAPGPPRERGVPSHVRDQDSDDSRDALRCASRGSGGSLCLCVHATGTCRWPRRPHHARSKGSAESKRTDQKQVSRSVQPDGAVGWTSSLELQSRQCAAGTGRRQGGDHRAASGFVQQVERCMRRQLPVRGRDDRPPGQSPERSDLRRAAGWRKRRGVGLARSVTLRMDRRLVRTGWGSARHRR